MSSGFKSVNLPAFYWAALTLGIILMFVAYQRVTAAIVNINERTYNQSFTVTVSNDNTFTSQTYLNTKLVHQAVTRHIEEHVNQVMPWKHKHRSFMLPKFVRSIVDGATFTQQYWPERK
ncbi:hypothetical protein DdX_15282 [Ditylenchus destructor]|uniref:Uncharacterized protein n=1 Tax=Ditylenchus destructor TaxID=166010 RepID=A0AAD4MQN2_9BILA|nr:hypothetical protein DdX_15282 [Ditylenchus destructor]